MNKDKIIDKSLSLLSRWWLSLILLFCSWFIIKQFWLAIDHNIFFAVNYRHVPGFSIIYFLMDTVTFIIHEGGHTIFGFFGWRFLTVLGGTLLQILIPFLIFVVSWRKNQLYISQIALYWLGFAWLDSSGYAADAYNQDLPLFGNLPKSAHDFLNMLSDLNILNHYKTVAWILFSIGVLILITGIVLPLLKREQPEYADLDLKI